MALFAEEELRDSLKVEPRLCSGSWLLPNQLVF